MKTLITTLGMKESSIQGISELFTLDLKHYHILHLKFWSQFQRLKNQNLSPTLKMRLKNGNQQIVLAAYAKHIYFRLALCDYFIIQSEAFFRLSFINIYYTIFVLQQMVWLRGSFSPIMTQLCPNCVGIESRSRHLFS